MRLVKLLWLIPAALLLPVVWILAKPLKLGHLLPHPEPEQDYAGALRRIDALAAADTAGINPVCRLKFLSHGRQTERVIIFWHGYTNCPQQYHRLGQIFFDLGYNVLVPRLPYHGLANRLSPDLTRLTAEQLAALVDEVVNLAHGLGRHITVVGFSAGGVLAGWAAQHRPDVDEVVIISPSFGLKMIPAAWTTLFTRFLLAWPNFFRWWDPRFKENPPGPQHAYPRFSSRALGQILRLGLSVQAAARRAKPAAASILVISNPADWAVNNKLTAGLVELWRARGNGRVQTFNFNAALELGHDIIDPEQVNQQVEIVYPVLVDLITANSRTGQHGV